MKKSFIFVGLLILVTVCGCNRPKPTPEAECYKLGLLTTLRGSFSIVSDMDEESGKALYRTPGSVWYSFDLSKAEVSRTGNILLITLPEVELLAKLDSNWETFDFKKGFWVSNTKFYRALDKADEEAEKKLVERAKDPDLFKIAKEQATILLRNFYADHFPDLVVTIK